jgi:hypothetical protein
MLPLCELDTLETGRARRVLIGSVTVLLVRTGPDTVHAYLNRCPHLGISLGWQDSQLMSPDGVYLQCSTHGAQFVTTTGECISGPCRGDQLWSISCTIVDRHVLIEEHELPTPKRT